MPTVLLKDETYATLKALGKKGETFDDIVRRLLTQIERESQSK